MFWCGTQKAANQNYIILIGEQTIWLHHHTNCLLPQYTNYNFMSGDSLVTRVKIIAYKDPLFSDRKGSTDEIELQVNLWKS